MDDDVHPTIQQQNPLCLPTLQSTDSFLMLLHLPGPLSPNLTVCKIQTGPAGTEGREAMISFTMHEPATKALQIALR